MLVSEERESKSEIFSSALYPNPIVVVWENSSFLEKIPDFFMLASYRVVRLG